MLPRVEPPQLYRRLREERTTKEPIGTLHVVFGRTRTQVWVTMCLPRKETKFSIIKTDVPSQRRKTRHPRRNTMLLSLKENSTRSKKTGICFMFLGVDSCALPLIQEKLSLSPTMISSPELKSTLGALMSFPKTKHGICMKKIPDEKRHVW